MARQIPYISGSSPRNPGPLARYLPPLPDGVVTAWLKERLKPGCWVLDPFGAAPRLAVEAARAGYRVLVAANNPVSRVLLEMGANPPAQSELQAALADLASAHKGEERVEPHIRSLYNTDCANCGQTIMAEYFLWERHALVPYARYYSCPRCGESGEHPTSQADKEKAGTFAQGGLHRARALERVAPINDPDRSHAEEALSVYLPRAVYALFTLINKLDALDLAASRRSHLTALMLTACDQANTLWSHPTGRERPRQLSTPIRFRENNVWLALEQGIEQWITPAPAQPLTLWPRQAPPEGGITMFEGRLKNLAAGLSQLKIGAVLAPLPRPNQAFWTLSALWAAWLWGRETVGPFKSVLRRRRYDWGWHASALSSAFTSLAPLLEPGTPIFGLIGETEPGFISAAMLAGEAAGLELDGLALRLGSGQAQIHWQRAPNGRNAGIRQEFSAGGDSPVIEEARQAAQAALRARGQPAAYLFVHTAALSSLAEKHAFNVTTTGSGQEGTLPTAKESSPAEAFAQLQASLKEVFSYRGGFLRYEGSDSSLDVGYWWLKEEDRVELPLYDRIELALVRIIQNHPGYTLTELDFQICQEFPGLSTPDLEFIHLCLDSYGEQDPPDSGVWRLRWQDTPAIRLTDLETTREMIVQLGERLGFSVSQAGDPAKKETPAAGTETPYLWQDPGGDVRYVFYLIASAAFGEIVFGGDETSRHSQAGPRLAIVLPGGRANLVAYKMNTNHRLKQEVEKGWNFLKYRHLRRLMENTLLTRENLDEQLTLDPLTYTATQIRLL